MKKKLFYIFIIVICFIFLAYFGAKRIINYFYDENIPILAYHVVSDNPKDDMEVSTKSFQKQMKFLHDYHFQVLSMEDVISFKKGEKKYPGKKVAITFDDGSESYYSKALPILKKYGFPSTNFIITSKINQKGYLTTEQIENLKKDNLVRLESHSYKLHNRDIAKSNDYDVYDKDFKYNSDYHFRIYAYPFGISNNEYIKALKDNDFEYAFKYAPSHWLNINDDNYSLSRVPVYNSTSYIKYILKLFIKR